MKQVGVAAILVAVVLLVAGAIAEAQQPEKIWRLGYLSGTDPATDVPRTEAIRQRLREHGYIEQRSIVIEYRHAEGKLDRLPELAAELVRLKVDIIVVAGGDLPIRAAMNATKTIPIVMTGGGIDPVKVGFVKSLAHPGGNVTGITSLTVDLAAKRVEVLKEAVGKLTRVAVLYDPASVSPAIELKEVLLAAAPALKLTISYWEVPDAEALDKVFVAMDKQRPDGLYVPTGGQM